MADIDRPERITNITGLRAQPESPPDDAAGGGASAFWPSAPCRLCTRRVWLFRRTCVCGMSDPARDARRPYVLPATIAAWAVLGALAWWWTTRR